MIKIAICDDDRIILEQLSEYLEQLKPLAEIFCYESGEKLLDSEIAYDVIFLDIDMKGLSGIDTGRKLRTRDKKVKIVYVTAYGDFQNHAFSVHAFGYLVKPVRKEDILNMLREALDYKEEESNGPRIRLQTEEGFEELKVSDIFYFEYQNRKIKGVTAMGSFHFSGTIGSIGERMQGFGFGIPHKSFVVNLQHVKNIKGYNLYMTEGSVLPLSQKKASQFREQLTRWLAQQI